jgi:glycosyltransferase involved in cell wall biosynthesis
MYNAQNYIRETIQSVLDQTTPIKEVLLIDDGSTDGTAEKVRAFGARVKLVRQQNAGAGAARNTGIAHATGEFFCFLDADDLWLPEKTEKQMDLLIEKVEMVFGQVEHFHSPDMPAKKRPTAIAHNGDGYVPGTMLIRRSGFNRVGPFRTDLAVGEFIDWYSRAVAIGLNGVLLDEVVLKRRIHKANLTRRTTDARTHYLKVIRQKLKREDENEP